MDARTAANPLNVIRKKIEMRGERGRLLPGSILNPTGRPKGRSELTKLLDALHKVEGKKKQSFAEFFVKLAFESTAKEATVACALARKIWPDKTEESGSKHTFININYGYRTCPECRNSSLRPQPDNGGAVPAVANPAENT
mgnify:CR=1 FL=1